MRPYFTVTGLLLLTAFGCQPEPMIPSAEEASSAGLRQAAGNTPNDGFRLRQIVRSGNASGLGPYFQTMRFEYVQERSLKQAVIPPTSPFATELTNTYAYDEQGRVSSYLVSYAQPKSDGNTGERHTFTYGQNTFEYAFVRIGADGQALPNQENTARDIYRFNQRGILTEWIQEGIIRFGQPTRARYVYVYRNGNITQATYINADEQAEFTLRYSYDKKTNPFYQWMYTIDPVLRYSHNNVVSVQYNTSQPYRTEYTYNTDGLPLTKKDVSSGAMLTYEYEAY